MAIRVVCPACDAAFSVADDLKGKKIRCRECEKPVTVAAAKPKKVVEDDDEDVEERVQTKPRNPAPSRPRDDDDEPARPASRRRPRRYDEDEDEDDDRKPAGKAKKASPMPWILAAVGGSVVVLGGVITLVIVLANREPEKKTDNTPPQGPPKGMGPMAGGGGGPPAGMMGGMGKGGPKADGVIEAGEAKRIQENVMVAAKELDPEVTKKIEASTLFIEFQDKIKDPTSGGTGSGFLAFKPGLVLTNAHVVDMLEPGSEPPEVLKVFVHHGTPEEKELKGKVLGVDRKADLAVLEVDPTGLPEPLPVKSARELQATSRVYVCGFPLGTLISNRVTIFQGQVASLKHDENHVLDKVIMTSEMQLGNSGGPVVDDKGNVVGVNVARMMGSRINMAIPGEHVHAAVNGRLAHQRIGQSFRSLGRVSVPITFELINPLEHMEKVEVEVWTGDDTPKYRPPGSANAPPTPRSGDCPHQRYQFDLGREKLTGAPIAKGSFALPDVPQGKVIWWQPIITFTDKDKQRTTQWLRGEKYTPDDPVERRQLKLMHKNQPGTRNVQLKIRQKFGVPREKGDDQDLFVELTTELVEKGGPADAKGKSLLKVGVNQTRKDIHIPEELVKDKKERELDPEEQRALDSTSFLDLTLLLSERGDIDKALVQHRGVPDDIRMQVDSLGEEILDALQAVYLQLPNRTVSHLETWNAERPVPILLPFGTARAPMKVEYTYLGVRTREGREEALVDMLGSFRNRKGGIQVGGRFEGRALVDVDTGVVTLARANVGLHIGLPIRGLKLDLDGRMEVRLQRDLPR
jgi:hypothetical protein